MNKFETSLLQTLSSIDESLKAIAAGKPAAKKAQKPGNGTLPKSAGKSAKSPEKGKGV